MIDKIRLEKTEDVMAVRKLFKTKRFLLSELVDEHIYLYMNSTNNVDWKDIFSGKMEDTIGITSQWAAHHIKAIINDNEDMHWLKEGYSKFINYIVIEYISLRKRFDGKFAIDPNKVHNTIKYKSTLYDSTYAQHTDTIVETRLFKLALDINKEAPTIRNTNYPANVEYIKFSEEQNGDIYLEISYIGNITGIEEPAPLHPQQEIISPKPSSRECEPIYDYTMIDNYNTTVETREKELDLVQETVAHNHEDEYVFTSSKDAYDKLYYTKFVPEAYNCWVGKKNMDMVGLDKLCHERFNSRGSQVKQFILDNKNIFSHGYRHDAELKLGDYLFDNKINMLGFKGGN